MADIQRKKFKELSPSDPFFESLSKSYVGFAEWFTKKSDEQAYVFENEGIQAFLYLKIEQGPVIDISPPLNTKRCLKIGTFKINAHGTKLGERFVKKIFDHAITENISHIYVTVFPEHAGLIRLLSRYGFVKYGTKTTPSGTEDVYIKLFETLTGDTLRDYPVVDTRNHTKWLLGIQPQWHTKLFPDSILKTEDASIVEDTSHTNSIRKVYIGWMNGMSKIKEKDIIVIYRTKEEGKHAWYSSVVTSICTVLEQKLISNFPSPNSLFKFAGQHSVFTEQDMKYFYQSKPHGTVLKMTYNIAFPKRLNMQHLVENIGLAKGEYWGFRLLQEDLFHAIIEQTRTPKHCII